MSARHAASDACEVRATLAQGRWNRADLRTSVHGLLVTFRPPAGVGQPRPWRFFCERRGGPKKAGTARMPENIVSNRDKIRTIVY